MQKKLFEPFTIKGKMMRNRIGLPPLVLFAEGNDEGMVSEGHVQHYRSIAQGGVGFIVQEATCVTKEGRLGKTQLGIWDDAHVEGLKKIVDVVHQEGCPIFLQIHHAGLVSVNEDPMAPSVFSARGKTSHAMSLDEIKTVQDAFVAGALRAVKAGYDGIELHGCHTYLICQFLNRNVNTRTDIYGQDRTRFVVEIIERIKALVPKEFIIGIRMGGFEVTLDDALDHAKKLEEVGLDFLDVSYGFANQAIIEVPEGETLKDIHYAAKRIKEHVSIPVFAVNGIRTAQQAQQVVELTNVDAVHLGRNFLVDPNWAKKVMANIEPGKCIDCVRCHHYTDPTKCPGRILLQRAKS